VHLDSLAPLLVLLIFFWKKPSLAGGMRFVLLFLIVQTLLNGLCSWLEYKRLSNYLVYSVNSLVSFGLVVALFREALPTVRQWVWVLMSLGYVLIFSAASFAGEGFVSFNSIQAATANFAITGLCLYYFYYHFVAEPARLSVTETPLFWCVIGLFTYYTGSFLISIFYKSLIENNAGSIALLWKFHNVLLLVACLYIAYGIIWKQAPKPPS
jgi:hypothetical protein